MVSYNNDKCYIISSIYPRYAFSADSRAATPLEFERDKPVTVPEEKEQEGTSPPPVTTELMKTKTEQQVVKAVDQKGTTLDVKDGIPASTKDGGSQPPSSQKSKLTGKTRSGWI